MLIALSSQHLLSLNGNGCTNNSHTTRNDITMFLKPVSSVLMAQGLFGLKRPNFKIKMEAIVSHPVLLFRSISF
jgi:hypothetical protein